MLMITYCPIARELVTPPTPPLPLLHWCILCSEVVASTGVLRSTVLVVGLCLALPFRRRRRCVANGFPTVGPRASCLLPAACAASAPSNKQSQHEHTSILSISYSICSFILSLSRNKWNSIRMAFPEMDFLEVFSIPMKWITVSLAHITRLRLACEARWATRIMKSLKN